MKKATTHPPASPAQFFSSLQDALPGFFFLFSFEQSTVPTIRRYSCVATRKQAEHRIEARKKLLRFEGPARQLHYHRAGRDLPGRVGVAERGVHHGGRRCGSGPCGGCRPAWEGPVGRTCERDGAAVVGTTGWDTCTFLWAPRLLARLRVAPLLLHCFRPILLYVIFIGLLVLAFTRPTL